MPLAGPGQAALTTRLHARFDWIVLDCGPLAGADAVLAHEKTADAVVIVDAAATDAATLKAAAEGAGIDALIAGVARTPAKRPRRRARLSLAVADDRQPLAPLRASARSLRRSSFASSRRWRSSARRPLRSTGRQLLQKLHPATYLVVQALILEAASRPRPLAYLAAPLLRFPGATYSPSIWRLLSAPRRCSRSRRSRR